MTGQPERTGELVKLIEALPAYQPNSWGQMVEGDGDDPRFFPARIWIKREKVMQILTPKQREAKELLAKNGKQASPPADNNEGLLLRRLSDTSRDRALTELTDATRAFIRQWLRESRYRGISEGDVVDQMMIDQNGFVTLPFRGQPLTFDPQNPGRVTSR